MREKVTKFPGMVTQFNSLNLGPGALVRANDCSMNRENVIEDRRGHRAYGTPSGQTAQLLAYDNRIISHNASALSYDNGSGTFADYSGNYQAPTGRKMRFIEASSNLYATTNAGVKVFSDLSGTAGRLAGAPRSLNSEYSTTGATGFLDNNYQCAYRTVIRRTDARSNVVRGYPSQRLWVVNASGGSRNISITTYLPSDAIATDIIEVYRTEKVSGTSSDDAGDEMGLVYQYELVSGDISAGSITFVDSVVDDLRGATLYTSPSEEGISQANDRPPLCEDMALYKTFMLFANTKTKQRLFSTLVGTGKLGFQATCNLNSNTTVDNLSTTTNLAVGWKVEAVGLPANTSVVSVSSSTAIVISSSASINTTSSTISFFTDETIALAGKTYAFGSSAITSGAGSPQVKVSITGVAASDIDITARSFEYVVNKFASNTSIYAYYISGPSDTPGKLMFEERGLGAAAFTIQASDSNIQQMFFPFPPVTPSTSAQCTSTQDDRPNAVYVAKSQQSEHVPALNYLPVGPTNKEILRIVALKDSAIVIKEEGVYRITGETFGNMVVTPIDLTVYCNAADSVAVLANQVFMLSNQGVVLISESGVQVISREIEPSLKPILNNSSLSANTFGAAYESERCYFLSTLTDATDLQANQTLVYNIFTRTWVRHTYAFVSAIVEPGADKIYFAKADDTTVYVERKSFDDSDFADPEFSITITALTSPRTVDFTMTGATPDVGWIISQAGTDIAIEEITILSGSFQAVISADYPGTWSAAAATIYPPVNMDLEFHSWTGQQNADALKQVHTAAVLTDDIPGNNSVTELVCSFRSNFDNNSESVAVTVPAQGWGAAWGSSPWGGSGDPYGYPTWVPRNKQVCTRMNLGVRHRVARERLVITGIGFAFEPLSEEMGR